MIPAALMIALLSNLLIVVTGSFKSLPGDQPGEVSHRVVAIAGVTLLAMVAGYFRARRRTPSSAPG